MALPIQISDDQNLMLMQTKWARDINPVLANALVAGSLLKNIVLINGVTVINHYLGRQMQGWMLADQSAQAQIFRSQPLNNTTITLTSNAAVTISLWVF